MMMRPRTVTAISTFGLCVLALVTPATAIEIDGREFVVLANKRFAMESGNTYVDLNVGVGKQRPSRVNHGTHGGGAHGRRSSVPRHCHGSVAATKSG